VAGDRNGDFAVVRHRLDGSIDAAFGSGGGVTTGFGGLETLRDLRVQSDGKLIAVGQSDGSLAARAQHQRQPRYFVRNWGQGRDGRGRRRTLRRAAVRRQLVVVGTARPTPEANADVAIARYTPDSPAPPKPPAKKVVRRVVRRW
jgi:hypothetical protein